MKRAATVLFIIAFCLFVNHETKAQCCPYINSVEIYPENPTTNDSVILVTSISLPALGFFLESSLTIDSTNLTFEACFFEGNYAVITDIDSNFNIGMFDAGEYHLEYIACDSYNPDNCVRDDTNSVLINFTVSQFVGIKDNCDLIELEIYPNPVVNLLHIKTKANFRINSSEIVDLTGNTVLKSGSEKSIDCQELEKGIYFLRIESNNNTFTRKIIKL